MHTQRGTHNIHTLTVCPPPTHTLSGAPPSSSSFISPSTIAFSADREQSTETEESTETEKTATEIEAEPEPALEPPATAAAAGSAGVMAAVGEGGASVGGVHQSDPEEELQRQHVNQELAISRVDPGYMFLSDPGKQCSVQNWNHNGCANHPPSTCTCS